MKIILRSVLPFLIIFFCSIFNVYSQEKKDHESKIKELHREYMEASNNHDIETLSKLTHEDIVWYLGPYTLQGKKEALAPNRYDTGLNNNITYSNVTVRGDTVDFELYETCEFINIIGMEGMKHYARFIFKDGLVHRKRAWKPSLDAKEYNRLMEPYRKWVRNNHSEALKIILDAEGNFIFSQEGGELMLNLAKQWQNEKTAN